MDPKMGMDDPLRIAEDNPVYKELRQIWCCAGAEFARPTMQKAWTEIARLLTELAVASQKRDSTVQILHAMHERACIAELRADVADVRVEELEAALVARSAEVDTWMRDAFDAQAELSEEQQVRSIAKGEALRLRGERNTAQQELAEERECCTKSQEILSEHITALERELAVTNESRRKACSGYIEKVKELAEEKSQYSKDMQFDADRIVGVEQELAYAVAANELTNKTNSNLTKELAEAKRDTARLSWWEKYGHHAAYDGRTWVIITSGRQRHQAGTLRAVIDEAGGEK